MVLPVAGPQPWPRAVGQATPHRASHPKPAIPSQPSRRPERKRGAGGLWRDQRRPVHKHPRQPPIPPVADSESQQTTLRTPVGRSRSLNPGSASPRVKRAQNFRSSRRYTAPRVAGADPRYQREPGSSERNLHCFSRIRPIAVLKHGRSRPARPTSGADTPAATVADPVRASHSGGDDEVVENIWFDGEPVIWLAG